MSLRRNPSRLIHRMLGAELAEPVVAKSVENPVEVPVHYEVADGLTLSGLDALASASEDKSVTLDAPSMLLDDDEAPDGAFAGRYCGRGGRFRF